MLTYVSWYDCTFTILCKIINLPAFSWVFCMFLFLPFCFFVWVCFCFVFVCVWVFLACVCVFSQASTVWYCVIMFDLYIQALRIVFKVWLYFAILGLCTTPNVKGMRNWNVHCFAFFPHVYSLVFYLFWKCTNLFYPETTEDSKPKTSFHRNFRFCVCNLWESFGGIQSFAKSREIIMSPPRLSGPSNCI